MTRFPAAPWSLALKVISVISTVVLLGVGIWAFYTHPVDYKSQPSVMVLLGLLAWGILLASALSVVRSYSLDGQLLRVQRLLWSTTVDLPDITATSDGTELHAGTLRLLGNAGVMSFSGLFYHRRIGTFRAFVTDWEHAVILHRQPRPVVISPADPNAMVIALQAAFPQLAAGSLSQAL